MKSCIPHNPHPARKGEEVLPRSPSACSLAASQADTTQNSLDGFEDDREDVRLNRNARCSMRVASLLGVIAAAVLSAALLARFIFVLLIQVFKAIIRARPSPVSLLDWMMMRTVAVEEDRDIRYYTLESEIRHGRRADSTGRHRTLEIPRSAEERGAITLAQAAAVGLAVLLG